MSKSGKVLAPALLLFATALWAQDSTSSAQPPASTTTTRRHMQGDKAGQRLKRLSKRLNLTDDQKEKLRPILQDEANQMKAVEDDTALTQQQKHRKMRDIRMASRSQMDGILTDEQKQKLAPIRTHAAGQHPGRRSRVTQGTPSQEAAPPDQGTSPQ